MIDSTDSGDLPVTTEALAPAAVADSTSPVPATKARARRPKPPSAPRTAARRHSQVAHTAGPGATPDASDAVVPEPALEAVAPLDAVVEFVEPPVGPAVADLDAAVPLDAQVPVPVPLNALQAEPESTERPRPPVQQALDGSIPEPAPQRAPWTHPPAAPVSVVLPDAVALMAEAIGRSHQPLACPLCDDDGGTLVARLAHCRVIRPNEPGFPALYRVVWNRHVAEWSDLPEPDQLRLMRVVNTIERTLRELLHPTKVNLASLGNVVPHLHWHVIARFDWDSHFPAPIWASPQRTVDPAHLSVLEQLMPQVDGVLRQRLMPW